MNDLSACRTARLGGCIQECSACGRREYHYRSCGNRHCPKCQAGCRAAWLDREAGYLLPVEYHHLVFTLPGPLAELARANPRVVYNLLFEAASGAVREVAANPKHLGAQVGLTAVLHTWGQTLTLHPHLHVMATGGGLSCNAAGAVDDGPTWRSCRPGFFLPVRLLSRLFKGKYLAGLQEAYEQGKLHLSGGHAQLADAQAWRRWLRALYQQDWVVYSQPPSAGAEVVLKYLARYTYRVAFSNSRLVQVANREVTFSYKDYRRRGKPKDMTLAAGEFCRRFLQHVLPPGFVRVRHYGLLANHGRQEKLERCREALAQAGVEAAGSPAGGGAEGTANDQRRCAACGQGPMRVVAAVEATAAPGVRSGEDSS